MQHDENKTQIIMQQNRKITCINNYFNCSKIKHETGNNPN